MADNTLVLRLHKEHAHQNTYGDGGDYVGKDEVQLYLPKERLAQLRNRDTHSITVVVGEAVLGVGSGGTFDEFMAAVESVYASGAAWAAQELGLPEDELQPFLERAREGARFAYGPEGDADDDGEPEGS
jgi:hypothetical protein